MPETMRPGGIGLTEHALDLIRLQSGCRILDIGCGSGATVSLLRGRGFEAYGIDTGLHADSPPELIRADAAFLPFPEGNFDAALFECSLSKIDQPGAALCEARRVLTSGGYLVVSDLFTQNEPRNFNGFLGRLEPWPKIRQRIECGSFHLLFYEEHGDALANFWGQLIFDHGLEEATRLISGRCDGPSPTDSSYFLAVFKAV